MIKSEYRIGRVWGIPIKIHISLLALMAYFAVHAAILGSRFAGLLGALVLIAYILSGAVLFFASIALHELGHSYIAIRKGCRVREITLMMIGGAAKMEQIPSRPRDEFLMAIAGPAVSVILGVLGRTVGAPIHELGGFWSFVGALLVYVGTANLLLACFNLLPAFPMDGGRVLRALLTPRMGRLQATYIASRLGRILAIAFLIVGLFGLRGVPILEDGNPLLVIVSIFVFIIANREYRMVQFEELMKQRGFGAAWPGMTPPPPPGSEPDDDTVLISPPPYAKGPDSKSELHHTDEGDDTPLRRFFGR